MVSFLIQPKIFKTIGKNYKKKSLSFQLDVILNNILDYKSRPLPQPFFVKSKGQPYSILPDNKIVIAMQTNDTNYFVNTTELPKIPIANGMMF